MLMPRLASRRAVAWPMPPLQQRISRRRAMRASGHLRRPGDKSKFALEDSGNELGWRYDLRHCTTALDIAETGKGWCGRPPDAGDIYMAARGRFVKPMA